MDPGGPDLADAGQEILEEETGSQMNQVEAGDLVEPFFHQAQPEDGSRPLGLVGAEAAEGYRMPRSGDLQGGGHRIGGLTLMGPGIRVVMARGDHHEDPVCAAKHLRKGSGVVAIRGVGLRSEGREGLELLRVAAEGPHPDAPRKQEAGGFATDLSGGTNCSDRGHVALELRTTRLRVSSRALQKNLARAAAAWVGSCRWVTITWVFPPGFGDRATCSRSRPVPHAALIALPVVLVVMVRA
jgi:hypothetical protein